MTNPLINQFAQTPVQGQLDLSFIGPVVTARVANSQVAALIAGQMVVGDTTTPGTAQDGVPPVISLPGNSTAGLGFVARNIKDQNFPANARLELAMDGACMYMTSSTANSGAITRFSAVEFDSATNTVLAWAGVNPICGFAYDASINAGDLIRVIIKSPQFSASNPPSDVKTVRVVATLAQINAGLTLIAGVAGKAITLLNYTGQVTGTFATGTGLFLESTNGTPVVASTVLTADIAGTGVITPNSANTTLGLGFATPLGTGDGLKVIKDGGTALTGGTSIAFTLTFQQA